MEELTLESLNRAAQMAQEMEDNIDILQTLRDDLLGMYELKEKEVDDLKNEIEILEFKIDSLEHKIARINEESSSSRASFTNLQVAVSILVFVYGVMYGFIIKTNSTCLSE